MFHYTVEVNKSIEECIPIIEGLLGNNGFGILSRTNFQEKMKEKGIILERPFISLEVCNPSLAKIALELNPFVGYFMPCKFTLYYDDTGYTKVGMLKPSYLAGLLGDPKLEDIVREIETTLIGVLNILKDS